jgi:hypothetical protein
LFGQKPGKTGFGVELERAVTWHIAMRPGKRKALNKAGILMLYIFLFDKFYLSD